MEGCRSLYCRGGWEYDKWYESKYIGKELGDALFKLFLNVDLCSKNTDKKIEMPNAERMETLVRECHENKTSDW